MAMVHWLMNVFRNMESLVPDIDDVLVLLSTTVWTVQLGWSSGGSIGDGEESSLLL